MTLHKTLKNPTHHAGFAAGGVRRFLPWQSTLLLAIATLLATLAVLEYRWTGEASSAEQIRIGSQLDSLMKEWHSDLYGEFSAICIAMQVGPDSGARDTWNDYLERYIEWNYARPHELLPAVYRNPDFVGEVYIWETGSQSAPRLHWLNLDNKKIEASPVPKELATLLTRLQAKSASLPVALHAWQLSNSDPGAINEAELAPNSARTKSGSMVGWQFDSDVPALVRPIFHHTVGKPLSSQSPVDWMVITLDMNVLRNRVLPELTARYFGGLEGLDYEVSVVSSGTRPRLVYSSNHDSAVTDFTDADFSMNILGPLSDSNRKLPGKPQPVGFHDTDTDWRGFAGLQWFPVIEYDSHPNIWSLVLRRRGSSLQSILDGVRIKNLALSALTLVLLTGSIGILTIAGIRAHKFAHLQMEFVASVSHELRTPLAAIMSAGENIKDGLVTQRSGLRDYGTIILSQSRQLMQNVDRILQFASMRSGKDRYNICPLDVSEILDRVRENTSALVQELSCALEEQVEPGLPRVLGDSFAVRGCLENLISNAAKYSGADRRIGIRATLEHGEGGSEKVAISVQDRGIGIKASDLKHIFEPFYRTQEVANSQIHGTGLGLSLAKHFADVMGCGLSVESEVGIGSVFTLRLPIAK